MNDNTIFPQLNIIGQLEERLFQVTNRADPLFGFTKSLGAALDRIGFTQAYVDEQSERLKNRPEIRHAIETQASSVAKVVKDIVWGMIDVDRTSVELLDTPILQRLRYIRQNGFTYLVYPGASHVRLEHSLGVLAVVSKYILSINASAAHPERFSPGLKARDIEPPLALDLKHAALMHDIGHFPFSHVLEGIFQSDPKFFKIGGAPVQDFEINFMELLPNQKSNLSEKLSIALLISPRFKQFYTALRKDEWAYLRVACLVSGAPLERNLPGYSQLISGAVDCDKVDYLLRDAAMCNVPVAIDQARLFLNSALIECTGDTVRKLREKNVLGLDTDLERPAVTLVLNSSGVDTIEEVAFARATLFERVYRHPVTRNAERILSVAVGEAAAKGAPAEKWRESLASFTETDDTFLHRLESSSSAIAQQLTTSLRRRSLPKRAFAFSPDFYAPIVPYAGIFSNLSSSEAASTYYHDVTSKDPFHPIVSSLKEKSEIFASNANRMALEGRIAKESVSILKALHKAASKTAKAALPMGVPRVFFVPLPDHSATPMSCAMVTHDGDLESSGDYSRAAQLVSAKEIGRSVGFVTCEPKWAEIVFLASQKVLYDYFDTDDEAGEMDLKLPFENTGRNDAGDDNSEEPESTTLKLRAVKRFYIAEDLAVRRCRLDRDRLRSHRSVLSKAGYYDAKPRLAEGATLTAEIEELAKKFQEFSGQHGWRVTAETIRQFTNQFPSAFRLQVQSLLKSFKFLNRAKVSTLLGKALEKTLAKVKAEDPNGSNVHIVPLAGTSAHVVLELSKQELRSKFETLRLKDYKSIHELLGVAKNGDTVIFVDDNVSSGTQFSAQLLCWIGRQGDSSNKSIQAEVGIERLKLNPNDIALLSSFKIRLATCVGRSESEKSVRRHLAYLGDKLKFRGLEFGEPLSDPTSAINPNFRNYLSEVGSELIRSAKNLKKAEADKMALGYSNSEGRTVTLWNVPTSTYTAFWCPGIAKGEPWFPLFIRRGYAEKLVIA